METKNINVVKSKTPYWILLKWERKDNEPMDSVNQIGAQDLTLDKINPKPAITIIHSSKSMVWAFEKLFKSI